jgi:hypothetical protein
MICGAEAAVVVGESLGANRGIETKDDEVSIAITSATRPGAPAALLDRGFPISSPARRP